ncbi:MAG: hypothetical protein E4H15_09050, partial [Syntrophobacterales bacterium]
MKRGMTELSPKVMVATALALILILAGTPAALALTELPVNSVLSVVHDGAEPGIIRDTATEIRSKVDFGVMRDTATEVRSIKIGGTGKVAWIIKWVEPWLTLDSYSGVVENGTQIVSVTAHPRGLSLGRHETKIVIATSSGTRTVPVSVTVLRGSDAIPGPELKEIVLVLPAFAAQVGRKVRLSALGVYSDGSERDITKEARWVSENKRVGEFVGKGLLN